MAGSPSQLDPYQQALGWLVGRVNYEASAPIPYSDEGLKLDRMRELVDLLGRPDALLRLVHVAGTKGKGSTGAMVAAGLRAAGLRVGVYSSPHLERFEERFTIDGALCAEADVVALVERVRDVTDSMEAAGGAGPTYFDLTTAIALCHFADRGVDAAVLEVGLGGRLDSTNVVLPAVSVITSISLDHTQQLGATRALIAAEKAGIIKPGVPVVSGVADPEAGDVIERIARGRNAPLLRAGRDFHVEPTGDGGWCYTEGAERIGGVRPAMPGAHQAANAAVALAVLGVLDRLGWGVPVAARLAGIAQARVAARTEWFNGDPPVLLDGAHNEASAAALATTLDEVLGGVPPTQRTLVLAISSDKDARAIVRALAGSVGRVVVTRYLSNARAIDPGTLAGLVRDEIGVEAAIQPTPAAAWNNAAAGARGAGGVVVVAGSLFLAGEVRRLLLAEGRSAPG
ncbi:MAG: bifunctional folylpolyglutamate synthase/dihydrofolate synthase [Lacipirellulaceae bacterium]